MRNNSLQYQYTTGRYTLPIVYFLCSICWLATSLITPHEHYSITSDNLIWNLVNTNYLPWWLNQASAYIVLNIIAYLLILLNNRFTIITQRATVQSSLYLLLITAIPKVHIIQPGSVVGILFILNTFFLFSSYKDSQSMPSQFHEGVFWGLLFLIVPKLIFLTPLVILTKVTFNALHIRTFLSSLLGFALPLWLLAAHALWHEQIELLYYPFIDLAHWGSPKDLMLLEGNTLTTIAYLLLLTILCTIYLLFSGIRMRVRTRQLLNHFNRISIGIILLLLFTPLQSSNYITIWLISLSFTIGHALISIHNKLTNVVFICAVSLLTILFVYNTWML